ncbi:hypothetical protein Vadar_008068 [Vaccinium darrowii]|uniref:Uncharacterized protein n=1 Tax=Vaccinium darrowii TaxID=229202 RepID=A0ACB7WYU9_9ERIC|nr:hypothetical protein Vadar_008068 [Vaccinium darrowii]
MDGLDLTVIDRWKSFFDSSGSDVFEAIEAGIMVAVWYEPDKFLMRRDHIAELLFKKKGDARGLICRVDKPQTTMSYCQNRNPCSTGSWFEFDDSKSLWESASLPGSSSTEEHTFCSNIKKLSKSCSGQEQAKPDPILLSTCMPAETAKIEEDLPKTRRIIKIKSSMLHRKEKLFPNSEAVQSGPEIPLKQSKESRICDEACRISAQTKSPIKKGVLVQNAPEKSPKQSTGRRISIGEKVQEEEKPKAIVVALAAASIATETSKAEEDKPKARKIVKTKSSTLCEKGKRLPNIELVQSEAEKSPQRSEECTICNKPYQTITPTKTPIRGPRDESASTKHIRPASVVAISSATVDNLPSNAENQQTRRNTELLLQCAKGKRLDSGHVQNAQDQSLKQNMTRRINNREGIQEKPKLSNKDEEAIELKLKATKRKLHEGYEQAQKARKMSKVIEFIDLPQPVTACAKTQKAKEHMRRR